MELLQVPPDKLHALWHLLAPLVKYGVEREGGRHTVPGIYNMIKTGEWVAFMIYADEDEADGAPHGVDRVRAVLTVQIFEELNEERICASRFLAGKNRTSWSWLVEALELFAVNNGCDRMEFLARKGWQKELRDYGYKASHILLEKRLRDGLPRQKSHNEHQRNAHGGSAHYVAAE